MVQASKNNYKFISFTATGKELMMRFASLLSESDGDTTWAPVPEGGLSEWTRENFKKGNILVYIGACGIAVRAIAPFVRDKSADAAVIVIDEEGRFVIPVLSGHLGGGVAAAKELSVLIGATPVITTASDVRGEFAVDVFAKDNDLCINDLKKAKSFSAYLLENGQAFYLVDPEFADVLEVISERKNLCRADEKSAKYEAAEGSFTISPRIGDGERLQLIPRCIVLGVGCRKGKEGLELIEFADRVLDELSIDKRSVAAVVSIDLKQDEKGITELADELGAEFKTFSGEELMKQEGEFSASEFVKETVGSDNVCERSLMAYGCKRIIMKKRAENGMTLAVGAARRILRDE
ncbi:cobalt-precorrin 5A hydrolase [Butyrivibrio sp. XPD2006]|uniref:cobalt-precorrin 5A hydrolase n=1 Tax=Butyrivibrio sp. XPD2006 TaxID=1280668 RepID=UPI0003B6DBEE|nr:cobalt-precorrin 5A hydrolase [Butyrivibrio sp. XPD2006]